MRTSLSRLTNRRARDVLLFAGYCLAVGLSPSRLAAQIPGLPVLQNAFANRGFTVGVDFGTGNDKYKRDWMNRHHGLWRIEAFNPARPTACHPHELDGGR